MNFLLSAPAVGGIGHTFLRTTMHICLVVNAVIPVKKYGGTERIVQWLAQEFFRMGHQVSLVAKTGSVIEGVTCLPAASTIRSVMALLLPVDIDTVK